MNIAVFCSSAEGLNTKWQEAAQMIGQWIGRHSDTLVYGGVDAGFMRILGHAVKEYGGTVVGVIPSRRRKYASKYNDVNIAASSLNDRKDKMQILSDVFIILPGGYGTLDEFASTFAYINFTAQTKKRIIIYNPDGLYDPLLQQLKIMADKSLLRQQALNAITVVTNFEQMLATLNSLHQ